MAIDGLSGNASHGVVDGAAVRARHPRLDGGRGPQRFRQADANGDRKLSWAEALKGYLHAQGEDGKEMFFKFAGEDGLLDRKEASGLRAYRRGQRHGG